MLNNGITEKIKYINQYKTGIKISMRSPIKKDIYDKFISWYILPFEKRERIKIRTESDFARKYDISRKQVYMWKQRQDFKSNVETALKGQSIIDQSQFYHSLLRKTRTSPKYTKMWLDLYFNCEKSSREEQTIIIRTDKLFSPNE